MAMRPRPRPEGGGTLPHPNRTPAYDGAVSERWRVLSLIPMPTEALLPAFGDLSERAELTFLPAPSVTEMHAALADAELVIGSWQGSHPLPLNAAAVAASGPSLAFVQQPSAGTDSVDVAGFAARGVPVASTAGANARSVAEWTIGATISMTRSLGWADTQIRDGGWPQVEVVRRGVGEIGGLRVGILGLGAVGSSTAALFAAFGCDVAYWSRRPRPQAPYPWLDVPALAARSDVLVLCLALAPETRGLVGPELLAALPRGAYLVDVSRGGVLDQAALIAALDAGHLTGAAVDVHPHEPLALEDPLRRHERVLLSPHAGGATRQAVTRILGQSVANLRRVLDGRPVIDVVNGVAATVQRRPNLGA